MQIYIQVRHQIGLNASFTWQPFLLLALYDVIGPHLLFISVQVEASQKKTGLNLWWRHVNQPDSDSWGASLRSLWFGLIIITLKETGESFLIISI